MATTAEFTVTIDGSGALVSNVSQHSGKATDFVLFRDLVTDVANRIVKRDGKGATLGSVAGTEIQSLHEYVYVDPATGVATNHILGAIDSGSYIYRWNGVSTWSGQTLPITPTAGGRWFFCNFDNRVFAVNGKDAMLVGIQTAPTTITWRTAGQAAPTAAATYSLTTNDPPYNTGTVTMVNGSAAVVGVGTAFVAGFAGKVIAINGVNYTVLSYTSGTALTLTENFKETSGSYAYNIYRGVGDWINPPRYAYAYYNPTTGHVSNVSPVLEITEKNQFGRTITVTIAGSAENTTAYNNGYTQIQLFRSAKNAYTLVALNEKLTNNNTASAIVYVETASKFADTFLTDLLAPFESNAVPPSGIRCIAAHQDRLFALYGGDLRFTPTRFELDFGKAAESWPSLPQFSRDAPEAAGLLVVGSANVAEALIVQTPRGDFSLDGFDPITFRIFKLKTRHSGGFLYSATSVDGDLAQFYRDKRLLLFPNGDDLGRAIQDKLNSVRESLLSKVRLHWFAAKSRNLLLLSVPSAAGSTANDYTYIFDLDKGGAPYEWNAGFSAFSTVHDATTNEVQLFAGDSAGAVYRLLGGGWQDAGTNFQPILRTTIVRPFDEQAWGRLKYWHLYVSDASGTWTGRLYIHEQTSSGATDGTHTAVTFRAAPAAAQPAQGKLLIATFTHTLRTKSNAFQLEVTFPSANSALHIEKMVLGFEPAGKRAA